MGHKIDADDVNEALDDVDDSLKGMVKKARRRRRTSPLIQVMAAIGFMAVGAILVPALWGLVAEAPNLRRYLRIRNM